MALYEINEDCPIIRCLRTNNRTTYSGPSRLYYSTTEYNKFIPILAINQTNEIIANSNSFLTDDNFIINSIDNIIEYNNRFNILSQLNNSYNILLENNIKKVNITENVFLLFNTFSARNSGHDLSILFNRINYYLSNKLDIPVIIGDTMSDFPFTLDICKLLLPNTKFYTINADTIIEFDNIIITYNYVFDINCHKYLHKEIQNKVINNCINLDKYKNKKICLLKHIQLNKNIVSMSTAFYGTKLLNILENKYNYIIINPEIMKYDELILYLSFASKILVSYGSIMYTNAIFFSDTASLYYIKTINNPPYYDEHRYKWVNTSSDLDSNIDSFISSIDEDLQIYQQS